VILTTEEANSYRTLYNNIDKVRPINSTSEDDIKKKEVQERTESGPSGGKHETSYPSAEDAFFARAHGQFYGQDVESYAHGKVARILGTATKEGKAIPKSAAGNTLEELMTNLLSESKSRNIDLTKKENWHLADDLGSQYARAAIAINKIPIAALGFDPSKIVMDTAIGKGTIGGAFDRRPDATYVASKNIADDDGSIVHEAIHRGLEKLRDKPELRAAFRSLPVDEEHIVRYMMAKMAGDPEGGAGSVDTRQRKAALSLFDSGGSRYTAALEKITKAAEQELKKRRPGGPR
jgi:hypothetical protein